MSLPQFPTIDPPLTREDAINQIISSIAMEEVAISHIINAEGEKLQYVLGTITGAPSLNPTFEQILQVNESVRGVLQSAAESQAVLRSKLQNALTSAVLTGPTGATGVTGPTGTDVGYSSALMLELRVPDTEVEILGGEPVVFDTSVYITNADYSYDDVTGVITANVSGMFDFYRVAWNAAIEGSAGSMPYTLSLEAGGAVYSSPGLNELNTQINGVAIVPTNGGQITIRVINTDDEAIRLSDVGTQAQIVMTGHKELVV